MYANRIHLCQKMVGYMTEEQARVTLCGIFLLHASEDVKTTLQPTKANCMICLKKHRAQVARSQELYRLRR